VLELISCKCRRCERGCLCADNGFSCTDACRCTNCENQGDEMNSLQEDDDDDLTTTDSDSDSESDV
jgi:hypothetical protein